METPNQTIVLKNPADLRPHPAIKGLFRWPQESAEFNALCDSIGQHGVQQALFITKDNLVMDGETRRQAAKRMQKDVPCVVRDEADLWCIVLDSELERRHLTKSQLAFKYQPLIEEAWGSVNTNGGPGCKLPNHLRGGAVPQSVKKVEDFAVRLGVSVQLLRQARELHALFAQNDQEWDWTSDDAQTEMAAAGLDPAKRYTFEEFFSARIMAEDGLCLGYALTALKQKLAQAARGTHGGGKPTEDDRRQLKLFKEGWSTIDKRWEYWGQLRDGERREAILAVADMFQHAPMELLRAMKRQIDDTLRTRKDEV